MKERKLEIGPYNAETAILKIPEKTRKYRLWYSGQQLFCLKENILAPIWEVDCTGKSCA